MCLVYVDHFTHGMNVSCSQFCQCVNIDVQRNAAVV